MEYQGPVSSQLEEEILALERRPFELPVTRVVAIEQSLAALWSTVGGEANTCTATYSGNLQDCNGTATVGQTLVVKDGMGTTLDTQTTIAAGAFSGSITITSPSQVVHLTGSRTGAVDLDMLETLNCGSNALGNVHFPYDHPPTLDALTTPVYWCGDPGAQVVNLTGIGDGDGGVQTLVVTVDTSSHANIPVPSVSYTSPATTGSITYTPTAGMDTTVNISVTVTDNGCDNGGTSINHFARSFAVKVVQAKPPDLNTISNPPDLPAGTTAVQTQGFSGVSSGLNQPAGPGNGPLTVTAISSNTGVATITSISYTSPNSTGSVVYTPTGSPGSTTISVTVTDNNANHCGTTTRTRTFVFTEV